MLTNSVREYTLLSYHDAHMQFTSKSICRAIFWCSYSFCIVLYAKCGPIIVRYFSEFQFCLEKCTPSNGMGEVGIKNMQNILPTDFHLSKTDNNCLIEIICIENSKNNVKVSVSAIKSQILHHWPSAEGHCTKRKSISSLVQPLLRWLQANPVC